MVLLSFRLRPNHTGLSGTHWELAPPGEWTGLSGADADAKAQSLLDLVTSHSPYNSAELLISNAVRMLREPHEYELHVTREATKGARLFRRSLPPSPPPTALRSQRALHCCQGPLITPPAARPSPSLRRHRL